MLKVRVIPFFEGESNIDIFDWMFIASGFIFFFSMICVLVLMANNKWETLKIFGVILAILMLPIIAILINYIIFKRDWMLIVYLILILSYLIAEFLLDRIFKIDFRSKTSTHVPYIILEWAAAFSFLFGTLSLDATMGWIIAFFFWAFIASLVYYIVKKKKNRKKE